MSNNDEDKANRLSDAEKSVELKRMKRFATGLLVAVTMVFLFMVFFPVHNFWTELIKATAEAAMVGAMADWFAVTALFRHPMGLKIPHTAIIPTRKDQIGERLGQFFQHNFLNGDVIGQKLKNVNIAGKVAEWLKDPTNNNQLTTMLSKAMAGLVRSIDDDSVQKVIRSALQSRLGQTQVTPVLGKFLEHILTESKRKQLILGLLTTGERLLVDYEVPIRMKISEETPWWFPAPIDDKIYNRMTTMLSQLKDNLEINQNHPLYDQCNTLVDRLIDDLKHSDAFIERGEMIKAELMHETLSGDVPMKVWHAIKNRLIQQEDVNASAVHGSIVNSLTSLGESLADDAVMQEKINYGIELGIRHLVNQYGDEVGNLIAQTVRGWDGESTSQRIELHVGKDLQYIRINGTIIGGLVGMCIHLFSIFSS